MSELSPRQQRAIRAMIEHGGDITAAADVANLTRDTIYRWLRDDLAFRQALRDAEHDLLQELTRQLLALGTRAVSAFADILNDPETTPATRLRAADMVLSRLLQLRELTDLETRVATLEAAMLEGGHQ